MARRLIPTYSLAAGAAAIIMVAAICASCGNGRRRLPQSGGRPYQAVVIGNDCQTTRKLLGKLTAQVPGLPQKEPGFDITFAGGIGAATKYARNMIVININSGMFTRTSVKYERNAYAEPQMIVYINTPSWQQLDRDAERAAPTVARLLERFETNAAIDRLTMAHNAEAARAIGKKLGCSMTIPPEMTAMKEGKDFVWLSDNNASAMQNICVFSLPQTEITPEKLTSKTDSVLKANIPGEEPGMYMATVRNYPTAYRLLKAGGTTVHETRGLWEMHADAMGGPYVLHAITDSARNTDIVAMAFVYAPGKAKRNKIKQLEAALFTLRTNK